MKLCYNYKYKIKRWCCAVNNTNKIKFLLLVLIGFYFVPQIGAERILDEVNIEYMNLNDCYNEDRKIQVKGIMIHSTACPGIKARDWFLLWNKSYLAGEINKEVCVHAFLDDEEIWQYLPWDHRGWHAGGKANDSYIGIEICEPKGIEYKENGGSCIINYEPEKYEEYIRCIWGKLINLCADLCEKYSINPDDIICHCEGYEMGIASNHKDVMHWWKYHGLDMNMFRKAVKDKLNETRSNIVGEVD